MRGGEQLGGYDGGGVVEAFERAFADYLGVKYVLATGSGTAALHAAYYAVDIAPEDEVLVPAYTFPATATPLLQLGALPRAVEIEEATLTISPSDLEKRLTSRCRAVVAVHLRGHPCEMDALVETCRRKRLRLVEDCSHAHGSVYKGRRVGGFGDVAAFSLDPSKALPTLGGGALATNSREVYEKAMSLGHIGGKMRQAAVPGIAALSPTALGHNYRMSPVSAALGLAQLGRLDRNNARRREAHEKLSEALSSIPEVTPPTTRAGCDRGAWYGYRLLYNGCGSGLPCDEYIRVLQAEGVDIRRSGIQPLYRYPLFQGCRAIRTHPRPEHSIGLPDDYPETESICARILRLPTMHTLDAELIEQYRCAFGKVSRWAAGG
jgi:dTDP-4-amino-4,6-dideoxygalactose transaminase